MTGQNNLSIEKAKPVCLNYGADVHSNGVNFRLYSKNATCVYLLFFDNSDDLLPSVEFKLHPDDHRFGDDWEIFINGAQPGQLYLYRIEGKTDKTKGLRYNKSQWLLDPWAKAISTVNGWGDRSVIEKYADYGDDFDNKLAFSGLAKCVVVKDDFDWGFSKRPYIPMSDTVIYEAHLRGLTAHPSGGFQYPGTYKGIIELIPFFKELGITALELLPIFDFNELENPRKNPHNGNKLLNYWGYSTVSFFAPMGKYSSSGTNGEQVTEFREMVKALHESGIEIILDVVFNHTAEGGKKGPVFNFKGIDNSVYYITGNKKEEYLDFTGCGNTFNSNHPVVRKFIVSCLEYWYRDMRVDGFRFDLATSLCRDERGRILENPPLIAEISESPVLKHAKLIAEAWDMNAYQVGSFPGRKWSEWNGRFRDDIRRFWKGESSSLPAMAYRLSGNSDLYNHSDRCPQNSINFITAHDGFTLNDLVSYNRKHNSANGEKNRDGDSNSCSFNHGKEGEKENKKINIVRNRQIKNFLVTLLISQGVPMLTAGDEIKRTQNGNNNAYCQDNEISWINWDLKEKNNELFQFVKKLIKFRQNNPVFHRKDFYYGRKNKKSVFADIEWFDYHGGKPEWGKGGLTLAFLLNRSFTAGETNDFYVMMNSSENDVCFKYPELPGKRKWFRIIDTADEQNPFEDNSLKINNSEQGCIIKQKSIVILKSK